MHTASVQARSSSPSTTQRLKEATAELHTRAERSEFQQLLIRGGVTREQYARWLSQLLLVHAELETMVRGLPKLRAELGGVLREELYQTPRLRADLAFFGIDPGTVTPAPATARIVSRIQGIAESFPIALLGFYYVLEGSKNGFRYIAKAIRRTLGIAPGAGDQYLDPHGDAQAELWGTFKRGLDDVAFEESEISAMIDAARLMFEAAEGIGADVLATTP